MRKTLIASLIAASLSSVAFAQEPVIDFGSLNPVQFGTAAVEQLDPEIAIRGNDASEVVILWGEGTTLFAEVRDAANPSAAASHSVSLLTGDTAYDGNGDLDVAWSPDGNTILIGWGEGDDAGASFAIFNDSLVQQGSVVDIADGVNKPKFDFINNTEFIVSYEGGEGINGGGAFARIYNTSGSVVQSTVVLNGTDVANDQNDPAVAIQGTKIVAAWEDAGFSRFTGDDDVRLNTFVLGAGPAIGTPGTITNPPANNILPPTKSKAGNPMVAVADDGAWMIAYEVEGAGDDEEVWASFYNSSDIPEDATDAQLLHPVNGERNQVISINFIPNSVAGVDCYMVTWSNRNAPVFARFFDKTGTQVGINYDIATGLLVSADARDSDTQVVGSTAATAWYEDNLDGGSAFFRVYTIDQAATSVDSWEMYN